MCIANIKKTERSQHQRIRTIRFYFYEEQKSRKNKSTLFLVKTVITPGGWVVVGGWTGSQGVFLGFSRSSVPGSGCCYTGVFRS